MSAYLQTGTVKPDVIKSSVNDILSLSLPGFAARNNKSYSRKRKALHKIFEIYIIQMLFTF